MSEELIIRHCSPTLAGIKTGSIFTCPCSSLKELKNDITRLNRMLVPRGLRLIPLRLHGGRALIYLYRPKKLGMDLKNRDAEKILSACGYRAAGQESMVAQLRRRLLYGDGFPHEIGLFLGYPPEDVSGFMSSACAKCVGCWKVYGDENSARRTFEKFRKCSSIYCALFKNGRSIERLIVADR